ncbi:hypothetical protein F0358_11570 [Empedobacter brevis]|uniref:hypothetical protein n=1 Tax=Empedobacter brevis TaxID=247 RepID=UPI00123C9341|nr:hypothetical protein [Empedobacter brevis]QES93301.1 hypothetical protein F0358_11570 [Empedobacter brevis]
MRTILLLIFGLIILFSCYNGDDVQNTVYKNEYGRRFIIFQDSLGSSVVKDSGTIRVSKNNNLYKFDFELMNQTKIDPIENIQMEMTGSNSLRNINWTPTKFILLSRDSINISYQDGKRYWLVNAIK